LNVHFIFIKSNNQIFLITFLGVTSLIPFDAFFNLIIIINFLRVILTIKFLVDLFKERLKWRRWVITMWRLYLILDLLSTHLRVIPALTTRFLKLFFSNFKYLKIDRFFINDLKLLYLLASSLRWMGMEVLGSFGIHQNLLWM